MARKGKRNDADDPPLDDRRWLTLTMAHHTLSERLVGARFSNLASRHLRELLEGEKLRCMRESGRNPRQREPVEASFWQDHWITADPDTGIQILLIKISRRDLRQFWIFYVWKPDFDKLWPSAKAARETTETSLRRKPGPPPTHEWPLVVAAEVIRRIKAGERDPTAAEMIEHCENTFPDEFSPGLKEMQVLLKKLLLGQF